MFPIRCTGHWWLPTQHPTLFSLSQQNPEFVQVSSRPPRTQWVSGEPDPTTSRSEPDRVILFPADQGSADLSCKGPGSKYFRFYGHTVSAATTHATVVWKQPRQCINEWMWLSSKKTLFVATKILISYNFHTMNYHSPFDFLTI